MKAKTIKMFRSALETVLTKPERWGINLNMFLWAQTVSMDSYQLHACA